MLYNFAYHSIAKREYVHAIDPAVFEKQLQHIAEKFTIISTKELLEKIHTSTLHTGRYATITFDDGFEDNYTNAFPILKKYNTPATIFVTTSFVGKRHTNTSGITAHYLTWEQMHAMQSSGLITIETHTHTHPLLTAMREEEIKHEIQQSCELLYTHLGITPSIMSYPKGDHDNRVIKIIAPYIRMAFGTSGVILAGERCNRYKVPRIIVSKQISTLRFRAMLHPMYWRLRRIRNTLRA